ncbi:MAG: GNAT family N-acetyltransferase [Caulobacter sp.]|nr:GNAT family N-acetyltransferase [Caulobacter sp.]
MSVPALRRLTAADVDAFRALRIEAMTAEPETFGTDIAEEREKSVEASAATLESTAVFGAWLDGELVGMAGFHRMKPLREQHKGTVWSMYVRSSARGHGLGGKLLRTVIEHARTEVEVLNLVVVSTNTAAVALYERHGFQRWGLEPRALKLDEGRYTTDGYYWLPLTPVEP